MELRDPGIAEPRESLPIRSYVRAMFCRAQSILLSPDVPLDHGFSKRSLCLQPVVHRALFRVPDYAA